MKKIVQLIGCNFGEFFSLKTDQNKRTCFKNSKKMSRNTLTNSHTRDTWLQCHVPSPNGIKYSVKGDLS
jgi:hypothetical protein